MKQFKPMLAPNEKIDLTQIKYPLLASYKLDGIRCVFKNGEMLSRSLKPIRNIQLQARFAHLIELSKQGDVLDGEIYGHDLTFQEITHFVMTMDLGDEPIPDGLKFYCFDIYNEDKFEKRVEKYNDLLEAEDVVVCVDQFEVNNEEDVNEMFETAIECGYEGLILKNPNGDYKCGRGTVKQGLIYKVKPFETFDGKIVSVYERMENLCESKINELGRSQKARHKNEVASTGIAGGFIIDYKKVLQKVTLTGDEKFRTDIWNNRESYVGKWIEFKGMLVGSKDKIRHPNFVRFREELN